LRVSMTRHGVIGTNCCAALAATTLNVGPVAVVQLAASKTVTGIDPALATSDAEIAACSCPELM
jgi:hypothetical protein